MNESQSKPRFSICVYCGSRPGNSEEFTTIAQQIGTWIGTHGGQLVYGGGRNGLMGTVANATLAAGGRVIGVIPQALVDKEQAHHGCTELHIVETMHERKRLMAEHADAFLTLPGGIGTLEEFFEIWAWRQLGYHDKPVGLLNMNGYYDQLLAFLASSVKQGFVPERLMSLINVDSAATSLLEKLAHASGLTRDKQRLDQT